MEFVSVLVVVTCEGGSSGYKDEKVGCYSEPDISRLALSAVLCALLRTAPNLRLCIQPTGARVHVEYTEGTKNLLQVEGCNATSWDRFRSSFSYGQATDFSGFYLVSREYFSPAAPASSSHSI